MELSTWTWAQVTLKGSAYGRTPPMRGSLRPRRAALSDIAELQRERRAESKNKNPVVRAHTTGLGKLSGLAPGC